MFQVPARAAFCCLLLLLAGSAEGQVPRPQKPPYNTMLLRQYVTDASFPWTISVCKGASYGGDYADLSDALEAIPSRFPARGFNQRVLVLIYPCLVSSPTSPHYEETTLLVPSWTTLQGVPAGSGGIDLLPGRVVLRLTGTDTTCAGCPSALVKLDTGASLVNLFLQSNTPPTGPLRILEVSNSATLTNVVVAVSGTEVHPIDLVYVSGGALVARDLGISRSTFSSKSRGLVLAGSSSAALYGGRFFVPSGVVVENLGSGALRLYGVRIDPSSNVDLKRSSTGTIETFATDYATESGGVIDRPIRADSLTLDNTCKVLTGAGSPEGVFTAPACSLYLRTNGAAGTTLYVKETGTGNTGWVAK